MTAKQLRIYVSFVSLPDIRSSFDVVHCVNYNLFAALICAVIGHTLYVKYVKT
jgi:hypothetical protein